MKGMRAQLSLELLLIMLIFLSAFLIILPKIGEVKNIADYALNLRNGELILDKLFFACERSLISRSNESFIIHALTDYDIFSNNNTLILFFKGINESKNISKQNFPCFLNITKIEKGKMELLVDNGIINLNPNL